MRQRASGAPLLDYLVRAQQQRLRDGQAERFRGFELLGVDQKNP